MFDDNWNLHSDSAITEHFIDRNPDCFGVLLDLLRTGELYIPPKIDKELLYREAGYYGILDHVRSAKWGLFDGNKGRLAQSIALASPSGWCCVAQGSVVRVYDWMLEEHPIIHIEHNKVNNVCWVDSETDGGIELFNASTGELRYKFQVTDRSSGLAPFATASTLEFGSDYKLFSSCDTAGDYHGIGVWGLVTGKVIDFLHRPPHCSHKNATRLQKLHGTNCLMALYSSPKNDICLFDNYNKHCSNVIRDALSIEESGSICVLGSNECLGFEDFRSTDASVNWRSKDFVSGMCFPKLAFHKEQLFSSVYDSISVYCGSDWLPTSKLRVGPICDFSIGGNRLFTLCIIKKML
ncbi:hypothetical protein R3W88_024837 [Solanum pinnatisectum]|uniref:BTB/POZ domain-containing protein n=1 Tax=Solanum pinnatisectum TaxID=50273 RepID=A0AAV9M3H9_9SOLN|nr:hypothetical protein R3W88_024837 [Solanum pinnatisectum]